MLSSDKVVTTTEIKYLKLFIYLFLNPFLTRLGALSSVTSFLRETWINWQYKKFQRTQQ